MSRHKFKVGQLVYCTSRESVSGLYEVTQLLPPEGDVFQYRIKNAKESHETSGALVGNEATDLVGRLACAATWLAPSSVFLRQHDGDDALGDRRISWVGRVRGERLIEIIDLEKDRVPVDFERAKIVFFVWVVGVAEIVVDRDSFDDARNSFGAEGGDTGGDEGRTDREVLAQFVVKRANGLWIGRHCSLQ